MSGSIADPIVDLDQEKQVVLEVHSGKQAIKSARVAVGSLLEEMGFMLEHSSSKGRSECDHSSAVSASHQPQSSTLRLKALTSATSKRTRWSPSAFPSLVSQEEIWPRRRLSFSTSRPPRLSAPTSTNRQSTLACQSSSTSRSFSGPKCECKRCRMKLISSAWSQTLPLRRTGENTFASVQWSCRRRMRFPSSRADQTGMTQL